MLEMNVTRRNKSGKPETCITHFPFFGQLRMLKEPTRIYCEGPQSWAIFKRLVQEVTYYPDTRCIELEGGDKFFLDQPQGVRVEHVDGYTEFWQDLGQDLGREIGDDISPRFHRDPKVGPAVIYPDGREEFWVKGRRVA